MVTSPPGFRRSDTPNRSMNDLSAPQRPSSVMTGTSGTSEATLLVGLGTSQHHPHHKGPSENGKGSHAWRIQDRVKTVAVGGVMCLHLGVDPPDILKTNPCARLECWVDPSNINKNNCENAAVGEARITAAVAAKPQPVSENESEVDAGGGGGPNPKAKEVIGRALIGQYEYWQPRARYKLSVDPTTEDLKRLCASIRKAAKEERALLHWNGHGTPRPTRAGEVWVFNRGFTQYIPVAVGEVLQWLGLPCTWVVDCSGAGNVLDGLLAATANGLEDGRLMVLAACSGNEILPMDPALPADLFTSCLTTPLEVALLFHRLKVSPLSHLSHSVAKGIPGKLNDRKTPLGLLGWAFTALTDTMAWSLLPRDQFKLLFRQDILTASLSRNFLLASRVMQAWACTPAVWPPLRASPGQVASHRLWAVWDHLVDEALSGAWAKGAAPTFFLDQLDAFEDWISHQRAMMPMSSGPCCEYLPIILQVLLSQAHRPRALDLLSRFFSLGSWAAADALDVGLFPYILKLLLQLPSADPAIRPGLLALWLQVLHHDQSTAKDLATAKEQPFQYFCRLLLQDDSEAMDVVPEEERQRAALCLAAFVESSSLATTAENRAKLVLNDHPELINTIMSSSLESKSRAAYWSLLGALLHGPDATEEKVKRLQQPLLKSLYASLKEGLGSADPWERASVCFLAGRLISSPVAACVDDLPQALLDFEQDIALLLLTTLSTDPSLQVRLQLIIALSHFVAKHFNKFAMAAYDLWDHSGGITGHPKASGDVVRNPSIFTVVWKGILGLAMDPSEGISRLASGVVDEVHLSFLFPPSTATSSAANTTNRAGKEVLFVEDRRLWRMDSTSSTTPMPIDSTSAGSSSAAATGVEMAMGDESIVSIPIPIPSPSPPAAVLDQGSSSRMILLPSALPIPSTFIHDLIQHHHLNNVISFETLLRN